MSKTCQNCVQGQVAEEDKKKIECQRTGKLKDYTDRCSEFYHCRWRKNE